jgi:hypothetical protein
MQFKITNYCDLDGVPAVVATLDTPKGLGTYCFEYVEGRWREPEDNGADVMSKSRVVTQDVFERMFPDVGLPTAP